MPDDEKSSFSPLLVQEGGRKAKTLKWCISGTTFSSFEIDYCIGNNCAQRNYGAFLDAKIDCTGSIELDLNDDITAIRFFSYGEGIRGF